MKQYLTYSAISITTAILAVLPVSPALAWQYHPTKIALADPQTMVCNGLAMSGLGCDPNLTPAPSWQPKPFYFNFSPFSSAENYQYGSTATSDKANLNVAILNASAPRDLTGQKINLVQVPGDSVIYELVNGLKHPFPSLAIFLDYGYKPDMIQPISWEQLGKYSRASLVKVHGEKQIYYLTEGGLVRPVLDVKKIFDIYGDRVEDVIEISRKEFNFYPANEYVYQIAPLNRDVFQISGKGKRYLTPMALTRLGLRAGQVAPVSKLELDLYKTLPPVID